MNKKYYFARKSFVKYDDNHYLLYTGEQRVDNYHPEAATGSSGTSEQSENEDTEGVTTYSYEAQSLMARPRFRRPQPPTTISPLVWFAPDTAKTR